MDLFEVFFIALSMAMDAFAVSLGAGTLPQTSGARSVFRLAFHFGLFQAAMPLIGYLLGATVAPLVAEYDHCVAFALLAFVGGRMIRSGMGQETRSHIGDPSRGLTLVLLSIAVSIDALAIGFTLAMLHITIWRPALVIGLVTGALSWLGLRIGGRLGETLGGGAEILGGTVLILIGLRILLVHLRG